MWLKHHNDRIEKERKNPTREKPYKKKGESILKKPSSRPMTAKTESDDSDAPIVPKDSFSIRFEDELYKKEKKEISLSSQQFITYLQTWFEETDDILIFDHMKEFDKELDKQFKEETDMNYDPI